MLTERIDNEETEKGKVIQLADRSNKLTMFERDEMAEENMRLVHFAANKFRSDRVSHEELYSIALVGVAKALNTFKKDCGVKFSTYAMSCMSNEIKHFLRKDKRNRENTVLSGTALFTDGEGNSLTLEDTITAEMNDEANVEDVLLLSEDLLVLMQAIDKLTQKEQYIIKRRYGLGGISVETQSKIAETMDMSQANISKLEQNILNKLFKQLRGRVSLEESGFYLDIQLAGGAVLEGDSEDEDIA